ncbi:RCC1 domain-containing protein [Sorangium sp. So ce131]|uniref:RCC1 domain-containing protein n=1 Tax=Sorangium sp. So ce131 TaxID=3133282 RepID=UPI003F6477A6
MSARNAAPIRSLPARGRPAPWALAAVCLTGLTLTAACTAEVRHFGSGGGGSGGDGSGGNTSSAGSMMGECVPGATQCQGNAHQVCDAGGHWSAPATCVVGCSNGGCVLVAEMSLGASHTCARLTDGTVRCWGSSEYGQLGDGTIGQGALRATPAEVPGLKDVAQIASGTDHVCARLAAGTAKCWGHGGFFKLGNGVPMSSPTPQDVPGLVNAGGLALGHSHSCAWLTDGSVKCWGANSSGELGIGSTADAPTVTSVPNLSNVTGMALGDFHSCALLVGGTAMCWGTGYSGQLGDGTSGMGAQKLTPAPVPGLSGVTQIAAGSYSSCALLETGAVSCWGANDYGQLGDGTTQERSEPNLLPGLAQVTRLALGGFHAYALRMDGTVFSWGSNAEGQLGNGKVGTAQPTPEAISNPANVAGVASGLWHTCAWLSDGNAMCWGKNDAGQLGDGTSGGSKALPTAVKW